MREDDAAERRAAKLSALLRATDVPAPPLAFPAGRIAQARERERRSRLRWQLAAAVTLLVAGAGFVPPVRAWIAEAARGFFLGASGPAAPAAVPGADTASAAPAPAAANVVTFVPREGAFVIELASRQQAGTLTLAPVGGVEASAALMGDPSDAGFVVRPDGVRIANRADARADYVVRVPPGVGLVTLRIGREPALRVDVPREYDVQVPIGPRRDRPE